MPLSVEEARDRAAARPLPLTFRDVAMLRGMKKGLLVVILLVTCIGCDQVTKDVAKDSLQGSPTVSLFFDSLHFVYAENPGVAFSLGAGMSEPLRRILLVAGVGLVLLGMGIFLFVRRIDARAYVVGSTLVMGGGIGNLLDRVLNEGHVIDFMMIRVGGINTAIFNVADVLIIAGVAMLVASVWRRDRLAAAEAAAKEAAASDSGAGGELEPAVEAVEDDGNRAVDDVSDPVAPSP